VRGGEAGAVTADRTPQGAVAVMAASRTLSHSKLGGGASPRGGKGAHGTTGRPPEETRTLTGLPEENSTTSLLKFFVPLQSTMIFMHTLYFPKNISQKLLAICLPPNINLAMNPEAPNQRFSPGGGGRRPGREGDGGHEGAVQHPTLGGQRTLRSVFAFGHRGPPGQRNLASNEIQHPGVNSMRL